MKNVFLASLALGWCALTPAFGQSTRPRPATAPKATAQKKPAATATRRVAGSLSQATVNEFCLNLPRYYSELPPQCREFTYAYLKDAGLTLHGGVAFTTELAQSSAYREAAYQSVYAFCDDIQFMYKQPIDALVFVVLYDKLHLNEGSAGQLTRHIMRRYHRPVPASPPDQATADKTVEAAGNDEGTSTTPLPNSEDRVYTYVEQMPSLPGGGGNAAIVAAVQQAIQYPATALQNRVAGRVFVTFTVDRQGTVSDIKLFKGLGNELDQEALRAVGTLPTFIPGKQSRQAVNVSFTLPVTFTLPVEDKRRR